MQIYGERGDQEHQDIPTHVMEAFHVLVCRSGLKMGERCTTSAAEHRTSTRARTERTRQRAYRESVPTPFSICS